VPEAKLPFSARSAVLHLAQSDARLAAVIERAGPFRLALQPHPTFRYLLRAIVYQQLNGKAARTIHGRVIELIGARQRPADLLAQDDAALRGAGLSRSKLAAVRDLAERAASGALPTRARLLCMDDEEVIERLCEVRGIGRWSAQMLLMFNLGRPDVLPVGDFGVRNGYRVMMRARELPEPEVLERRAERWRPYRSVASWYLWRAVELNAPRPV
jgi:3-methyladenine DNA glycosylase/8-oxoguanine DNA glycosylase